MPRNTRSDILDAAEAHFAADGYEGASLRAIMREADVNPAAVHYHFGGRQQLFAALLDRTVAPLNARRLDLLDELRGAAGDGPIAVRGLVDAFLRPDFEAIVALRERGPGRAGLIGRAYGQPTPEVRALVATQFAPIGAAFFPELTRSVPSVDPETLGWRLRWGVVGVIVTLFSTADDPDGPIDPQHLETSLARAVDFVTAGLAAPN